MQNSAIRSEQAAFIEEVAAEITARRPELTGRVTTTASGLGVPHPAGGTIVVGQARFACVLGWAVAGPEPLGAWPAVGDDVDGVVTELLRRHDDDLGRTE